MEYDTFFKVFLAEMPWRVAGNNDFLAQLEMLRELISYENEVTEVSPGIFKVTADDQYTYWAGNLAATNVSIIVDATVIGNYCKVTLTSKNPSMIGKPPFASDLYLVIIHDLHKRNIMFASDSIVSDNAVNLWVRLLDIGKKLSVFDSSQPQYALTPIATKDELLTYVGDSLYQKYIFVLSENIECWAGINHAVSIMELKRKSGYPLTEMFARFKSELNTRRKKNVSK